MKKMLFTCCIAAMALTSCVTTTKTAKTADLPSSLYSATVADLDVAEGRVSATYIPTAEVRRGGDANVKAAAIREALGGKYDVLVEPEFIIDHVNYFFKRKISRVIVSGRPAKYTKFRSLNDNVWTNDVFRSSRKDIIKKY